MASSDSPVFRNASKTLRDAARKEFRRTQMGQLVDQAQRKLHYGATNTWSVHQALLRYMKSGPREALRELRGTPIGLFARSIEKYSRQGPMKRMLEAFLQELGPAGKLLSALSGVGGGGLNNEIAMMRNLLRMFGHETLGPTLPKKNSPEWFRTP